MALSTVRLIVLLGKTSPAPAPGRILRTLENVEVHQEGGTQSGFGQGFSITFRAERGRDTQEDYDLMTDPLLKPGGRVVLAVTVNGTSRVLMDGIISQHHFQPSHGTGGAQFTVSGADLSVMMDLVELAIGYPSLGHVAIANLVLIKYAAFGVMPLVIPPPSSWTESPLQAVPFQDKTDLQYLRDLAGKHGFVFGIKPGPIPGKSIGYWGPSIRVGFPQKPLSVDMGTATNVKDISFDNNALTPLQVYGSVHNRDGLLPKPVLTVVPTDQLPLARRPAMLANQPFVRKQRLKYQGHNYREAFGIAQGQTNSASSGTVTASGTLDVMRYGDVLSAPGVVGVRGCGESYDGFWFVTHVTHQIRLGEYTQSFQLSREGTGSWTKRL